MSSQRGQSISEQLQCSSLPDASHWQMAWVGGRGGGLDVGREGCRKGDEG